MRPELDGTAVMEQLGVAPGREVGEALAFLLEIRLDEGLLGDDAIRSARSTSGGRHARASPG